MPESVGITVRPDKVAVITFSSPPVNALSLNLRRLLALNVANTMADRRVQAVVLRGERGVFSGGADIREFGELLSSNLGMTEADTELFRTALETGPKPTVACVEGLALGGGCELALACNARVASSKAQLGLPELKLGLIPGLGGTQRLPRLIGVERALDLILTSKMVAAEEALQLGLVDAISAPDAVLERACQLALQMATGQRPRPSPLLTRTDRVADVDLKQLRATRLPPAAKERERTGQLQFEACVLAVLDGLELNGGTAGWRREAELFAQCAASETSKALIHVFFASRGNAGPMERSGVAAPLRVAVIGGGLMGSGIATAILEHGGEVLLKEVNQEALQAAYARIQRNLSRRSRDVEQLMRTRLHGTTEWVPEQFRTAELVIEAAVEDVPAKQGIFRDLVQCTGADCVLATNTSTINLDLIGEAVPEAHAAGRLVGAHFFSPAHVMPLLEVVRAERTAPRSVQMVLALAKQIKKTPIVVGNCAGFAVNRMYFPETQAATFVAEHLGVHPYDIDAACEQVLGLPMGPFRLVDLVGLDVGASVDQVFGMAYPERVYRGELVKRLLAAGRKGQKSGGGFYRYADKGGRGLPDREALAALLPEKTAPTSTLTPEELVQMVMLPVVNEAMRVLEEQVAQRAADLDIASVMGYGFPAYRGGILYWAQHALGGPQYVLRKLSEWDRTFQGQCRVFVPSFALMRAAAATPSAGLPRLERPPRPPLASGHDDDVVVVSALRTPVGRAGRGQLKDTPPEDMVMSLIEAHLARTGVPAADIGDVVVGTVLPRGDLAAVSLRVGALCGGLPESVPVRLVNRLCSSGLQAIADAAAAVQRGDYPVALAGGVESMSLHAFRPPEVKRNPRTANCRAAEDAYLSMGETSENVAERFGVARRDQDVLAAMSHSRAAQAVLSGRLEPEIVPLHTVMKPSPPAKGAPQQQQMSTAAAPVPVTVRRDEGFRLGVTVERLAKLPPVFRKDGTTTAGNSSQISDGAALVMLMKRGEAQRRGLQPLGALRSFAVAGVDPAVMGIGPAVAIPKALQMAGIGMQQVDLLEINEAFGSQAEYCVRELGVNRDILNVNGGAIALGHPLGMTGARLTTTLLHELDRRQGRYGVVSMCIGTGMGAAAVFERNDGDGVPVSSARRRAML